MSTITSLYFDRNVTWVDYRKTLPGDVIVAFSTPLGTVAKYPKSLVIAVKVFDSRVELSILRNNVIFDYWNLSYSDSNAVRFGVIRESTYE
jgi:hypothetical protein